MLKSFPIWFVSVSLCWLIAVSPGFASPQTERAPYGIGVWHSGSMNAEVVHGIKDEVIFARTTTSHWVDGLNLNDLEIVVIEGERYYSGVYNAGAVPQTYRTELTANEFDLVHTGLTTQGYQIVDFETYEYGGVRFFAGVWHLDSALTTQLDPFLSEFEITDLNGRMEKNAYGIVDLESWTDASGMVQYAGIWQAGASGRTLNTGEVWADFLPLLLSRQDAGLLLMEIDSFEWMGSTYYTGVWKPSTQIMAFTMGNCYENVLLLDVADRGDFYMVDFERVVDDAPNFQGPGNGGCALNFPPAGGSPGSKYYGQPGVVHGQVTEFPNCVMMATGAMWCVP